MSVALTFGLMTLQHAPYAALADRWHRAEATGWESVWIADHTTAQYPKLISYEAWSLMGALASETQRVRIGTLVTPVLFRHPALLAQSITTVDHVSGGRVEVGIGAGGAPADAGAVGLREWPPGERLARLEEQVVMLDALLRGERVDREAGYYPTRGAVIEPPLQRPRPPLVVAANGPRALRIVARHADVWNTLGGQPTRGSGRGPIPVAEAANETARHNAELDDACREAGRDPRAVRRQLLAYRIDPGPFASVDRFEEVVGRYREAGIEDFVFYWPSDPQTFAPDPTGEATLERVARDVLPRWRGR